MADIYFLEKNIPIILYINIFKYYKEENITR